MKIKALILLLLTCGATAYASVQTTDSRGRYGRAAHRAKRGSGSAAAGGAVGLNQQDYQRYQQLMNGPGARSRPASIHSPRSASRRAAPKSAVSTPRSG